MKVPAESQAIINKDSVGSSTEMSQSSVAGIIANQTPSRAGGLQDSLHEWNHVRPRCDFRSASRLSNGPLMVCKII